MNPGARANDEQQRGKPVRERLRSIGHASGRDTGPLDAVAARLRRPLDRLYLKRFGRLAELDRLGRDVAANAPPGTGARVLVLSLRAWPNHAAYELVIAHALRLRGAEVALVTCGGGQPVCELGRSRLAFPRPCDRCAWYTDRFAAGARLPTRRLAERLEWGADGRRAPEADPPEADVAAAGISAPWFLRTAEVDSAPGGREVVRDFGVAAHGVRAAAAEILDEFQPDRVLMVNGLFAAERVFREVALERGLAVPTYEIAPRAGAIVLSQGTPAPEYDTEALWREVGGRPLTPEQAGAIDELLRDRAEGVGAHERYYDAAESDLRRLRHLLDIPEGAPVVSLFTNLTWDSATLFHDVAYGSMLEWVEAAVAAAERSPGTVLVVRIHPAERRWGSLDDVEATVRAKFPALPGNVRFVGADEPLSSYALLKLSDLVLAYTTTVGLEAAAGGVPVAVAGRTHYRGKGFTVDVTEPGQLDELIASPPGRLDAAEVELAHRYAFTFFFRSMVPFPLVPMEGQKPLGVPTSAAQLEPGRDRHLDWICDRLLDGEPFALPDHLALAG